MYINSQKLMESSERSWRIGASLVGKGLLWSLSLTIYMYIGSFLEVAPIYESSV